MVRKALFSSILVQDRDGFAFIFIFDFLLLLLLGKFSLLLFFFKRYCNC